jgi:hypothetical protein
MLTSVEYLKLHALKRGQKPGDIFTTLMLRSESARYHEKGDRGRLVFHILGRSII